MQHHRSHNSEKISEQLSCFSVHQENNRVNKQENTNLTDKELDVLALMARSSFSIRQIKDAVQLLQTTDIAIIEAYLQSQNYGPKQR